MFLSLSLLERLGDQKLRCYLGQLKIEIAKAEKMHGLRTMNVSIFIQSGSQMKVNFSNF